MAKHEKAPAFQFYPKDWLTDIKVKALSFEEKGIYIELLSYSWLEPLEYSAEELANIIGANLVKTEKILDKFFVKNEKVFENKKLENYRKKIEKFTKERKKAGEKGAISRWNKSKNKPIAQPSKNNSSAIAKHMAKPMANDSSSVFYLLSSSSNILSKDNMSEAQELVKEENFGKEDINKMLQALKIKIGISDFVDSQKWSRIYGQHLCKLLDSLGKEEFVRRLEIILNDSFKSKNCNSIKYIYGQIKGFKEPVKPLVEPLAKKEPKIWQPPDFDNEAPKKETIEKLRNHISNL